MFFIFIFQRIFFNIDTSERGIIFCLTKNEVHDINTLLVAKGIGCGLYHSDLEERRKQEEYKNWWDGCKKLIVATSAFSLGNLKNRLNLGINIEYSAFKNYLKYTEIHTILILYQITL